MEKFVELTRYYDGKVVVVEVGNGESREEAWLRHLLSHPENARAQVKIFHYPPKEPSPGRDIKPKEAPGPVALGIKTQAPS